MSKEIELRESPAIVYLPENCVECTITVKVFEDGKLQEAEKTMSMQEVKEAFKLAEENYDDPEALYRLTPEGERLAERLAQEKENSHFSDEYDNSDDEDEDPLGDMEIGNFLFGNSRGEFHIERGKSEEIIQDFFKIAGLDAYGHVKNDSILKRYADLDGFINTKLFSVFPYYWGDDEELELLPNFVYKPEDIEIQWYKYPFRDSYSNVKLSTEKLKEIFNECSQFVEKLNSEKIKRSSAE